MYHHYGNKRGLFGAVLEHSYDAIRAHQKDVLIRGMDPVTGMRQLVINTGRIWVRFPEFLRILSSENMDRGEHIMTSTVVREKYDPLLHTIPDMLAIGRASCRERVCQ